MKITAMIIVIGSVLVGLGRFTIPGHSLTGWPGAYEAFAHMFVGALIALILIGDVRKYAAAALILLSALEVVAFVLRGLHA